MQRDNDFRDFSWIPDWHPQALAASDVGSTPSARTEQLTLGSLTGTTHESYLQDAASQAPGSLYQSSAQPIHNIRAIQDSPSNGQLLSVPTEALMAPRPAGPARPSSNQTAASSNGIAGKAIASDNVKTIVVSPSPDRTVRRQLRGSQLFMITVNATLGTGLYWKGGQILQLGGPLAVLVSFLSIGILAWAVMQSITEMLCIWPIPGALSVYVSEFVDIELGIAMGITYWFTYSVSFAAIIVTSAAEVHFWGGANKIIDGTVMFFIVPIVLIGVNSLEIKIYGWVELVTGSIKVIFLAIIVTFLLVISGSGSSQGAQASYWDNPFESYDHQAVANWPSALMLSMSIVAFSYVGVEIVAASALEVRWPKHVAGISSDLTHRAEAASAIGSTVRWSAIWIPVLVCFAYTLCGVLISFNIPRDDCSLPRFSWAEDPRCINQRVSSSSAFVAIALRSKIRGLENLFNALLLFTALTCAMTNLYVASRSMFALASRLDRGAGQPLVLRFFAWFGKTNRQKVPMRAMIFSSLAFVWVPFLNLIDNEATNAINVFVEVLGDMGTTGVFIIWACECLAFLRFYYCIKRHQGALEQARVPQVRRWNFQDNDYPYRSHGQPFTAYMGLAGCLILLIVSNLAYFWKKTGTHLEPSFQLQPFLSHYLIVLVFLVLWVALKLFRGARWGLVDLSDGTRVVRKIKNLHDLRQGAM